MVVKIYMKKKGETSNNIPKSNILRSSNISNYNTWSLKLIVFKIKPNNSKIPMCQLGSWFNLMLRYLTHSLISIIIDYFLRF